MDKEAHKKLIYAWRAANPDKVRAIKQRYYATQKGKEQKARSDAAFIASGGRALAEAKRATKPLSEARKEARRKHAITKRSLVKNLTELDELAVVEAESLRVLRNQLTGIKWDVDHIIPVSKGGTSAHNNLQVVPSVWNKSKSNRHTNRYFGVANG